MLSADDIRQALARNKASLRFQTIYSLVDDEPRQFETFIRINRDDGSEILPADFLPAAEQAGLMPAIDKRVLELVTQRVQSLKNKDGKRLAVNISMQSLLDKEYRDTISSDVWKSMLPYVVFEVKSREVASNAEALKFIRKLQANGASVTIDYVNGGAAFIELSARLGFESVKVDMLKSIDHVGREKAKLRAMCRTAHICGMEIICERVETLKGVMLATEMGATMVQGYLFGMPQLETTETRMSR
ncbi:MAG: EAL domain-containing protein [Pseudomonadaceae bacterium]|nr:EAL domain-containing protein [Pseudomonadaceae bacterium]